MEVRKRKVPGLGDVANSDRCLLGMCSPFLLTIDSVGRSNVSAKIHTFLDSLAAVCGQMMLYWPLSCTWKSPG